MILGIDQAIRSTGITIMDLSGKVVAQHVVYIPAKLSIVDDIDITQDITRTINTIGIQYKVTGLSIELPAFSSNSNRSKQLSMLFGSIIQGLSVPYIIVNPLTLKKFATGKGRWPKEENKTVMMDAWKKHDEASYTAAINGLESQKLLKSIVTRAMGDLADSYWLAAYMQKHPAKNVDQSHDIINLSLGGKLV